MTQIVAIAERLAANAPDATLACPICGVGMKAANLERHLGKVHPGQDDAGTSWRGHGFKGGRLTWSAGTLEWRSRTGLRTRTLTHVREVAAGSTLSSTGGNTADGSSSSYSPSSQERSGAYVQLRGEGRPITVRCRSGATARKAWVGWVPGQRVTRWQITLDVASFVALLYLLVEADVLRPKPEVR